MSAARMLWVLWCLGWAGLWLLLGFGTAGVTWLLVLPSAVMVFLPVGRGRLAAQTYPQNEETGSN